MAGTEEACVDRGMAQQPHRDGECLLPSLAGFEPQAWDGGKGVTETAQYLYLQQTDILSSDVGAAPVSEPAG